MDGVAIIVPSYTLWRVWGQLRGPALKRYSAAFSVLSGVGEVAMADPGTLKRSWGEPGSGLHNDLTKSGPESLLSLSTNTVFPGRISPPVTPKRMCYGV